MKRHSAGGGTLILALLTSMSISMAVACAAHATEPLESYRDRVDDSIDRGLAFLAQQQLDGDQPKQKKQKQKAKAERESKTAKAKTGDPTSLTGSISDSLRGESAITSLCIMAFLSKGHTPGQGPYGEVINAGVDYILAQQDDSGLLYAKHASGKTNGVMYTHCISTLLLAEVTGMVDAPRQRRIDQALPKALTLILRAQNVPKPPQHAGGWRYQPNSQDSDLSLTGWAVMALRAGKLNGAAVPGKNIENAVQYILRCRQPQSGGFAYTPGGQPNPGLTAAGILCLELCGQHGHEAIAPAGDFLLKTQASKYSADMKSVYGIYYCGQAAFQLGPAYWEKWAPQMYENLLAGQQPDGGWPAAANLGRCFSTAMAILAMTPSYRQLPIYQRDESFEKPEPEPGPDS